MEKILAFYFRKRRDFSGDEARMLILFSALPLARKRNLISPEQEKFLSNPAQKFQTPPKCITDAWDALKASGRIS